MRSTLRIIHSLVIATTLSFPVLLLAASETSHETASMLGGEFRDLTKTPIAFIETSDYTCSGVLVGPNLVLTAAHCIAAPAYDYLVHINGFTYAVSQALYEGAFDHSIESSIDNFKHDLGMLILSSNVNSIAPIPVLLNDTFGVGDRGVVMGFGTNEYSGDLSGSLYNYGKVGLVTADSTSDGVIFSTVLHSGASTCAGDSGGPLLQTFGSNSQLDFIAVSGVVSAGTNDVDEYGNCVRGSVGESLFVDTQSGYSLGFLANFEGVRFISGPLMNFYIAIRDFNTALNNVGRSKNLRNVVGACRQATRVIDQFAPLADTKRATLLSRVRKNLVVATKAKSLSQAKAALKKAQGGVVTLVSYSAF